MSFERTYDVTEYLKYEKNLFKYLVDEYKFNRKVRKGLMFSYISEYKNKDIRVYLKYDFREQWLKFQLIRGKNTPDHSDRENPNIKMFWDLFEHFEPGFDYMRTQPDEKQYLDSLKLNAELLKKYGDKLLRGEEWYW